MSSDREVYDRCVYTSRTAADLSASLAPGGHDTHTDSNNWMRAKQLLDEAKRIGCGLPVLFARAEDFLHLHAWAWLDEVTPGASSTYTFSALQLFEPRPARSSLMRASGGLLDDSFTGTFAVCMTPDYLRPKPPVRKTVSDMPEPYTLRVGDRIRIVAVPKGDLWALASGATYLEKTVRMLEWMVGKEYTIAWIDDDGKPWVDVEYPDSEGAEHSMAIMDSESWVHIRAEPSAAADGGGMSAFRNM